MKKKSRTLVFILSLLTAGLIQAYGQSASVNPDWVDWFQSSALSPSGELVATGDLVGNVKLWNLADGSLARSFSTGSEGVGDLLFSPDGKLLVLQSRKNPASIWETATGKQLKTAGGFERHSKYDTTIAISVDGTLLLTRSLDGKVKLWDFPSCKLKGTFSDFKSYPIDLCFSQDGRSFLSLDGEGGLRQWDTGTGKLVREYSGFKGAFGKIERVPGRNAFTVSSKNSLSTFDLETGKRILAFVFGDKGTTIIDEKGVVQVKSVLPSLGSRFAWSPDGKNLVLYSNLGGFLTNWSLEAKKMTEIEGAHTDLLEGMYWAPDGSLVTVSCDRTIKRWSYPRLELLSTIHGFRPDTGTSALAPGAAVYAKAVSPDGKITALGVNETIQLRETATGALIREIKIHFGLVRALAFSADGAMLASGGDDKALWVWNPATGEHLLSIMVNEYPVKSVAFSPDGKEVLVGTSGGALIARVSTAGGKVGTLSCVPGNTVCALAYSPDGRLVLAGTSEVLAVYNAGTGKLAFDYKKQKSRVLALAWSRDGGKAAAALSDGALILLNASDLSVVKTFSGYGEKTRSVSFKPDGTGLRTESIDEKVLEVNLP